MAAGLETQVRDALRHRLALAWIGALWLLCGAAAWAGEWVEIPAGRCQIGSRAAPDNPPRPFQTPGFHMGLHEVTVREYCVYLSDVRPDEGDVHPQVTGRAGQRRPVRGQASHPVAGIDRAEAEAYAAWRSERTGASIRLPDPEEWEYAARAGRSGVRFAWGWGNPKGRAIFDARSSRPVGSCEPNGFGLYDMAGNVFEWCRGPTAERVEARGGSWAERDVSTLEVYRRSWFETGYRDADVGFRLLMEPRAADH